MPFRSSAKNKAKAKKKAQKKKAKDRKRDDWEFDGGIKQQTDNDEEDNDDTNNRKKFRRTQQFDDKQRRLTIRNSLQQKKRDFVSKMSKKVKFSDFIESRGVQSDDAEVSSDEGTEDDPEDAAQPQVEKKPLQPRNELPIAERLQRYILNSMAKRKLELGKDNNTLDDDGSSQKHVKMPRHEVIEEHQQHVGHEISEEEMEEPAEEDEEDGETEKMEDESSNDNFHIFFQSEISDESHTSAQQQIIDGKGITFELTGSINSSIHLPRQPQKAFRGRKKKEISDKLQQSLCQWDSIVQLPGVHKLFKHMAKQGGDSLSFDTLSRSLVPCLSTYADAFIDGRDMHNDRDLLHGMLLHATAHVVKARARVLKHNQQLKRKLVEKVSPEELVNEVKIDPKKKRKQERKAVQSRRRAEIESIKQHGDAPIAANTIESDENEDADGTSNYRDQGYCRPRLLILCPFRHTALEILIALRRMLGENTSISGWDKFQSEFGLSTEEDDIAAAEEEMKRNMNRPEDWKHLFENKNVDDDFKMGIQVNPGSGRGSGAEKGVYLRLYSEFYISDIIIASPIGLRLTIERGDEIRKTEEEVSQQRVGKTKGGNADFLSSLEMVLLHQADVLYMQNWEHVQYILQQANQLPSVVHPDTDFSRVRQYFLDGKASKHRQLIINSSFSIPEISAFYRQNADSGAGRIRLRRQWSDNGCLTQVVASTKQVFQIVPAVRDFSTQEDVRFSHFKDQVLAPLLRINQAHTLIVTPSYLSFVRLRNELLHQDASAAFISEYSRESEISRGRSRFFHGQVKILLYSGRAHFFRRFFIRGARHLIMYSLPEYPHYYAEFLNMLSDKAISQSTNKEGQMNALDGDGTDLSALTLCTPFEKMALERIVGSKRCSRMLSGKQHTFMFC